MDLRLCCTRRDCFTGLLELGAGGLRRGAPVRDDASSVEPNDAPRPGRYGGIVSDEHDRSPACAELLQHAEHLAGRLGIEVAGRLVSEDEIRLVDERAGDGDALLLAAGQFAWFVRRSGRRVPRRRAHAGAKPSVDSRSE